MPVEVSCPHCSKKLRAPTKYVGKTVKCPHCQAPFAVQGAPEATEEDGNSQWHVQTDDDQQYGPVSKTELDQWVKEGRLDDRCQVLRADWDQWRWADEVYPELRAPSSGASSTTNLSASAAPTPTPAAPTPAAPTQAAPTPAAPTPGVPAGSPVSVPSIPAAPTVPTIDPGGSAVGGAPAVPVIGAATPTDANPFVVNTPAVTPAVTPAASPVAKSSGGSGEQKRLLATTAPWTMVVAIVGFVFAAMFFYGAIRVAILGIRFKVMTLLFTALFYSALSFFGLVMPGVLLIKYNAAIKRYLLTDSEANLLSTTKAQQSFWQYFGIFSIVIASLALVLFMIFLFVGSFFSSFIPMPG